MQNREKYYVKLLFLLSILINLGLSLSAQTTPDDKPKTKDFGSSLKKDSKSYENEDDEVLRVETNLVVQDILVFDKKGRSVTNLKKEDFIITENGEIQDIQMFSLGDNVTVPRTIVLIIDYSASQRPYIDTSVEAAKMMIDRLNLSDRMAIITDDVSVLVNFTSDKILLKQKLDILKILAKSNTFSRNLQYSALFATLNEMFSKQDIYPIIIFQTDGDELPYFNSRIFTFEDILKATEKARATIYTIIPSPKLIGLSEKDRIKKIKAENKAKLGYQDNKHILKRETEEMFQQQLSLEKLSKFTGGWNEFLETPERANEVYPKILEEINRRYIIGYYPTNDAQIGNQKNVKIEVRGHPDYRIERKKSEFAKEKKDK